MGCTRYEREYMQQIYARMQAQAELHPSIARALQLSNELREAYKAVNGNADRYKMKREQILKSDSLSSIDWDKKYNDDMKGLVKIVNELQLAAVDRDILKTQLLMNGIEPVI